MAIQYDFTACHCHSNILPNIRNTPQQKPNKYVFIFLPFNCCLTVTLLLEKGAYPENLHVLCCHIKSAFISALSHKKGYWRWVERMLDFDWLFIKCNYCIHFPVVSRHSKVVSIQYSVRHKLCWISTAFPTFSFFLIFFSFLPRRPNGRVFPLCVYSKLFMKRSVYWQGSVSQEFRACENWQ